jgi:ABC-type Fe3+/spermidine/putrescine transport system ATPase subunit
MADLAIRKLTKLYGGTPVVAGVDLDVASGEFVSLLGPSGCGKSTLLRMLAGLVPPSSGAVLVAGADITALPAHRRGLGLVFQSYALFPHLDVAGNVAFGLRRKGLRGEELQRRVAEALALVRLGHLAARFPRQLSGGQQQRVALARAVAPRPRILLLDEPLSNLDAQLRDEMQIEIKQLQRELGLTAVFVTHDQAEALSLSDRVCVLDRGVVQQIGTPEAIYHAPANGFVAGFIGRSNRLIGRVESSGADGCRVRLADGAMLHSRDTQAVAGRDVGIVIRHDAIHLSAAAPGLPATVMLRSFSGARVQLVIRLDSGSELISECAGAEPAGSLAVGDAVHATIDPAGVFIADSAA